MAINSNPSIREISVIILMCLSSRSVVISFNYRRLDEEPVETSCIALLVVHGVPLLDLRGLFVSLGHLRYWSLK